MAQWRKSILLRSTGNQIKRQLRANLKETGPDITQALQVIVGEPPPPSKPNNPPHIKEGELQSSIDWVYEEPNPFTFQIHVGSDSDHALFTEYGLKYAKRPWLRPYFAGGAGASTKLNGQQPIEGSLFPTLYHGF